MAVTLTRKQIDALSYEQLIELKTRLNDALETKLETKEEKQKMNHSSPKLVGRALKGIHVVSNKLVGSKCEEIRSILHNVFPYVVVESAKVETLIGNNHYKVSFQSNQQTTAALCWNEWRRVEGKNGILVGKDGGNYRLSEFGAD